MMSSKDKRDGGADDCQLRVRRIENGYLVISGPQYYCKNVREVEDRVLLILQIWERQS